MNSNAGWDNHSNIDTAFAQNAPGLDKGIATLITDLKQRGLLDNTLVILWSEFSRTKINLNGGRDHNPNTNTLVFFSDQGKGVVGETSENGLISIGDTYSPSDLAWTIGDHMGLDKRLTIKDNSDRPRHVFKDDARNILS